MESIISSHATRAGSVREPNANDPIVTSTLLLGVMVLAMAICGMHIYKHERSVALQKQRVS